MASSCEVPTISSPEISCFSEKEVESQFLSLNSLKLLKQCGTKTKCLREQKHYEDSPDKPNNTCNALVLPTDKVMKLAKALLLQLNSQKADVLSSVKCFFEGRCGFSSEVAQDLELALLIQAAAEKVADEQFDSARKFLSICDGSASKSGNPVQRVVYYFSKALKERIDREEGIVSSDTLEGKARLPMAEELDRICLEPAMVACQQELPFCLETQYITTESILEYVASEKRVHLIDFEIDSGSQWTLIMQAFAVRHECPVELLKITAVGTCKETMEETGKRLSSFAETINLPFSFKVVVADLKDLKEDLFELEADKVVAIDLAFRLWTLLAWPNHLEALIETIKNLNPCVMVLKELETSTNAPIFLDRFNETLFDLLQCTV